jgi:hypothetical protein
VPRALAIVALVAAAALALRGRSGLDWGEIADPLDVRWSRLVLGGVLLALLVSLTLRMYRRLRRASSLAPGSGDEHPEPEGEPFPFWIRVLFTLLVLATMAAVFFVITSFQTPHPEQARRGPRPVTEGHGGSPTTPDTATTWTVVLVVAVLLLLAALGWRWLSDRRNSTEEDEEDTARQAEVARLVQAVDAAEQELYSHGDPRAAVLAAYAAMARHLGTGLVRRGKGAPRSSDTASELLDRSVSGGLVSGGPAGTLTALFREARFSTHPMGPDARTAALQALAEVRNELSVRHG